MSVKSVSCYGVSDGQICLENLRMPTSPAVISLTHVATATLITALPDVSPPTSTPAAVPGGVSVDVNGTYCWYGLPGGSYNLVITDASGVPCTKALTVVIPEPDSISVEHEIVPGACGDSAVTVIAMGEGGTAPYSFTLENTVNGYGPITKASGEFKDVPIDTVNQYDLTITDVNGCTTTSSFLIQDNKNLKVDIGVEGASCYGKCDGKITAVASNGVPPYRYKLTSTTMTYVKSSICDDQNCTDTYVFDGLCQGDYNLEVTDANGCTVTYEDPNTMSQDIRIIEPTEIVIPTPTIVHVSCNNCCDGSFEIATITGGTPNYVVELTKFPEGTIVPATIFTDGTTPTTISGLSPGNYEVTITDSDGCSKVVKFGINSPSEVTVTV